MESVWFINVFERNYQTNHELSKSFVYKYLMFKEAYSYCLICYCSLLGLGSRPVIADKLVQERSHSQS